MKIKPLIHERILTAPYEVRMLPCASRDRIRVVQTLFGWELHVRHEKVPCRSEAEARYLAAFARMGFYDVPVPVDLGLVESVVDDLESEEKRITTFIEEKASTILSPDRRRQLIEMVWAKVRKRIGLVEALHPLQDEDDEPLDEEPDASPRPDAPDPAS